MDMRMNKITSDVSLINIEQHFRVSAGAGAGKTHWLVEHIKNVLHRSERLAKTRKIACITYTNIAVETILCRLGTSAEKVEVSTIHSFLYRYIVKPYASFIAEEYGLNVIEMDGHDEIIHSKLQCWFDNDYRTLNYLSKDRELTKWHLDKVQWRFNEKNELKPCVTKYHPDKTYERNIKFLGKKHPEKLVDYKKLYWQEGTIHHDDVLFFSYKIIEKYPFVLQVLQKQFPYFFIDEFQDTNPIQIAILSKIGQSETKIGVIGDQVQSIYKFQGAEPEQFSSFSLLNIIDYQMAENRRSTNEIIDILNDIRKDITQEKYKNEVGDKPVIIVGENSKAYKKAKQLCNEEEIYSLSRDNITSNAMKIEIELDIPKKDLFPALYNTDNNRERRNLIIACIKATELAREGKFKDAIKELERIFRDKDDKEKGKKEALKNLQMLLKSHDEFKSETLYKFYEIIKLKIKTDISGLSKDFYEKYSYQELALCVKISEDKSFHKTIHKAKGDEFDNVFLVLKEEKDLNFFLKSDLIKNEEHRINYVAVSRAKKRLFISVPDLSDLNRKKLEGIFQVIFID